MVYLQHVPGPPLNAFVAMFWYYEGLDVPYTRERVLPDGTFELIINLREETRKWFPRDLGAEPRAFHRAWMSGTHSEYIIIDVLRDSSLIGAHFLPGGAAAFLPLPADRLRDEVVDLESLWGPSTACLRDALKEAGRPADKFRIFEAVLTRQALRGLRRDPAMKHAIEKLSRAPRMGTLDAVARDLGLSHKQFIARFRAETGLTPKRFCRIHRFQEVLKRISSGELISWADLAIDCGYYDQSHFIQEFHGFSGLNPSAYLRDRGEFANHVPCLASLS